jgi:hypothetical protein
MLRRFIRLLLLAVIFLSTSGRSEYLKDEDVHLQIYSPPTGQHAIALELIIYNRDEEFYVRIMSEEGKVICAGQFSRFNADRVKCSFDTAILRDGDNSFHVTIATVATNEIVLDTISHFFYSTNQVIESSMQDDVSESWDTVIAVILLLLIIRYGMPTYRGIKAIFLQSSTDSGSPPPPPPSLPITAQDFELPPPSVLPPLPAPVAHSTSTYRNRLFLREHELRYLKAALIGLVAILGGRAILGRRNPHVVPHQSIIVHSGIPLPPPALLDEPAAVHYPQTAVSQTVGVARSPLLSSLSAVRELAHSHHAAQQEQKRDSSTEDRDIEGTHRSRTSRRPTLGCQDTSGAASAVPLPRYLPRRLGQRSSKCAI